MTRKEKRLLFQQVSDIEDERRRLGWMVWIGFIVGLASLTAAFFIYVCTPSSEMARLADGRSAYAVAPGMKACLIILGIKGIILIATGLAKWHSYRRKAMIAQVLRSQLRMK